MQSQGNSRGVGDHYSNSLISPFSILIQRAFCLNSNYWSYVKPIHLDCVHCRDSELIIPNYQVLRLDRNRHGGGILLYIHNSRTYSVIKGPSNLELMLISVGQASSTNKFCIDVFYRSPTSPYSCMDDFCSFLEDVDIL